VEVPAEPPAPAWATASSEEVPAAPLEPAASGAEPAFTPPEGRRRSRRSFGAGTTRRRRSRLRATSNETNAAPEPAATVESIEPALDVTQEAFTADAGPRVEPTVDARAGTAPRGPVGPESWTVDEPQAPRAPFGTGGVPRTPEGVPFGVGHPPSPDDRGAGRTGPFRPVGDPFAHRTGAAGTGGRGTGGRGTGSPFGRRPEPSGPDPLVPDPLGPALGRLDPGSAATCAGALRVASGALASGERVERLVAGRAKGLPCVVARTERRLMVVAERPGQPPLVESLHPLQTMVAVEPAADGTIALIVSDGRRVMRLQGVRDRTEAELLAVSHRADPTYF
jgi:hypothetical protein